MGKGLIRPEIRDMLYNFYLDNLLINSRRGITYTLLLPAFEDDRIRISSYKKIRELMDEDGIDSQDIFRMYSYGPVIQSGEQAGFHEGGYVFDLRMGTVKAFADKLAESFPNKKGKALDKDVITRIKQQECQSLATYCVDQFNLGKKTVQVVLFRLDSTRILSQQGIDKKTKEFRLSQFNTYTLSPDNDLRVINNKLLIISGIKITRVEGKEVLPSRRGVRYVLTLDSVAEDIIRHINSEELLEEV